MLHFKNINIVTLSIFLRQYYVEDNDSKFRLWYSEDIIEWILNKTSTLLGLYLNDELIGTIAAIPGLFIFNGSVTQMVEINFLCCHPNARNIGIAKLLINEITIRCSLNDIFVGFFTGINNYNSFAYAKYYHHHFNIEKLIKNDFCDISQPYNKLSNSYLNLNHKYINIDETLVEHAYGLYMSHMTKHNEYKFYQKYNLEEFRQLVSSKYKCVTSYIIMDLSNNMLDIILYYILPTYSIKTNAFINNAYIMFYTDNNISLKINMANLFNLLENTDIDVCTVLNIMDFDQIINDKMFNFYEGTGHLYYNFRNNNDTNCISNNNVQKMIV